MTPQSRNGRRMRIDLAAAMLRSGDAHAVLHSVEPLMDQKLTNRRILLVEDDMDTQELLRTVLEQHGAEVIAVESSTRALAEFSRKRPDLIISDIGMVGENGYDFIRRIRSLSRDEGGHIPAIALTAYAGVSDRRRALLAGFQTHLAKPVEPADLVAVILSLTFSPGER